MISQDQGLKKLLKKYTYPIWQGWQDIHPYSQPITLLFLMMYYLCVMIHGIGNPEGLQQLEKSLAGSKATYKFVMLHEPVIPVNERCWHVFRQDNAKREQLLQIIASQQAIVLCAHLHLYSVVCRDTPWGPIVQILVNSVIKDKNMLVPKNVVTDYGPEFVTAHPQWQPSTLQQRMEWIDKETPHIRFFKQMDLPGYGILSIDKENNQMQLEYYAAFGEKPYDTVNISELLTSN